MSLLLVKPTGRWLGDRFQDRFFGFCERKGYAGLRSVDLSLGDSMLLFIRRK